MAIFRSIPSKRIINGVTIETSDSSVVSEKEYVTSGEYVIITKGVEHCTIFLNHNTSDHIVIKALTKTLVKTEKLIDEEFEEVDLNYGSCVEFKFVSNNWYILSSDGLKGS